MITDLFRGMVKLEKFLKHLLALVVVVAALSHACSGYIAYNIGRAHEHATKCECEKHHAEPTP